MPVRLGGGGWSPGARAQPREQAPRPRARSDGARSVRDPARRNPLDPQGHFALNGIDPSNYLVELLDSKGKVVCTEGPFDLTKLPQNSKPGVNIQCGNPAAWWLLAAAGAAGITAGVVVNDPVSPAR